MTTWKDYFKIVEVDNPDYKQGADASDWLLGVYSVYQLHDPDGKVIATYKDYKYAKKQAKYKFRKMISKLEIILLG